ncbi:MAG: enoyl-CoA hydratase/isomerase family protein [Candidatus Aminicenantes bacterium]|nr:MAG: enoyl-CoA hydratase/isomerase family protein [Candidatus Aminicenantes bacterium]
MAWDIYGRSISKVGVIGSGNIGPDIALYFTKVLQKQGIPVIVVDIAEKALKSGEARVKGKIGRGVKSGAFKQDEAESMMSNLSWTSDYSELSGADLVIEAATEDVGIKRKIFAQLEKICPETAIFASNSSHMEPEFIFEEMKNKERCLVIHYFFPAERSIIVEVVPGKDTASEITGFLMRFYEEIGKAPIRVKGRFGYAIDPIFEGIFLAALLLVDKGVGTVRQVNAMAQRALGLGVGPFTAMNLTGGNPITQHGLSEMHDKIGPWFHCPDSLNRQVESGKWWDTGMIGEDVSYSENDFKIVSDRVRAAYFGLVCETVGSGISNIGDLEMAVESALVVNPPFQMMNKIGVDKALELVRVYAKEWPEFIVPEILVKQAESGKPWDIPMVLREDRDDVSLVTIRRPNTLNALNATVMSQLKTIFTDIKQDSKIKGAVLTGFGKKAFVSGADINEFTRLKTPEDLELFALKGQETLNLIENLGKPVICALNGLAFGGGNELAMACTTRIAKKGLRILTGQPEPKLGIIPGYGGSQRLPRIVGFSNAWPILRTGNPISSEEALKIGLIHEEIEGDIIEEGIAFARKIISGELNIPPIKKEPIEVPDTLPEVDIGHLSRKTDELLQKATLEGAKMTLEEGLKHEAKILGECIRTKDMRIGIETFMKFGAKKNAAFSHV